MLKVSRFLRLWRLRKIDGGASFRQDRHEGRAVSAKLELGLDIRDLFPFQLLLLEYTLHICSHQSL